MIIGGGILGLATARELQSRRPGLRLALLEKETTLAAHQTGHNSGVIHSGVYYRPGSLKARLCLEGRTRLLTFCAEQRIPHRIDGTIIVARDESELGLLEDILRRGRENGVPGVTRLSAEEIGLHKPHVRGAGAVWVPGAGVVDFGAVARALAREITRSGGEIFVNHRVSAIRRAGGTVSLQLHDGIIEAALVIACAGLQSDRLAGDLAEAQGVRIVPFRGDYYLLQGRAQNLIRALVYPVPDHRFPFLGIHFARHIHGEVTAGPNAVLTLARERYDRFPIDARDAWATLRWPGFWRLAFKHWSKGIAELWRDYVQWAYWRELQKLLPSLDTRDMTRGPSGIRAQAVRRDGTLVDDFLILETGPVIHVLNAPSPAATSSLAIAREVVDRAEGRTPSA